MDPAYVRRSDGGYGEGFGFLAGGVVSSVFPSFNFKIHHKEFMVRSYGTN